MGVVKGETFVKLLKALVQSVLLYKWSQSIWGCGRKLGVVEEVQLRVARMFPGASRQHQISLHAV